MASIKYYKVTRRVNGQTLKTEIVMACNYLEAQEEAERQMPIDITYDAVEMNDDELSHYFKQQYKDS